MMPTMHRFVIAGLVAMATALSLPACPPKGVPQKAGSQGVPRKTAIGTFTDSNGQPLAGASVHFAFVPVGGEHLAPADAVEAVTDDRGRFRVALLSCTKYRAWGIGKLSEAGSRPVSEVVWTTAADLLELRAARDFAHPAARGAEGAGGRGAAAP